MAKKIKGGLPGSLWGLGAGLLAVGCAGQEISVGQEGAAFNLERCYGDATHCAAPAEAPVGVETEIRDCPERQVGILEQEQMFAIPPGEFQMQSFKVGPDGSIWALSGQLTQTDIIVGRWSPEGAFLGISEPLAAQAEHTELALDGAGHVLVLVHSLSEPLTIHVLTPDLKKVREPLTFRGLGDSHIVGGAGDTFSLAGDARDNAAHGVLAHVTAGGADWVQTAVPSGGAGAGVGVSALAVSADGEASVLAQRNPKWEPGTPVSYGIARFDQAGNPLWNLLLPTAYVGGWRAQMVSLPSGDVVVRGVIVSGDTAPQKLLVRLVTGDGRLGWGYRLPDGTDDALEVDAAGRTVLSARESVAVISADGQSCKQYGLPWEIVSARWPSILSVSGSSVYSAVSGGGVARYRLPAD